ncbi:CmpA/NrtA family ABC transporter substrate-binding protein [Agaribacter flavus]|uniref:CmpA/NrtA family ABC transporter substrate-binding protein n=1 Tax=Agaribacter flavus TaxID=1902781 RepID=A0ABV7FNE6_9ALTE
MSSPDLNIGYMPLNDAAPLIIAKELGFFEQAGLEVQLRKQNSWATLRDKLHVGLLDAAHMLAPMPIASSLGLGCQPTAVVAPLIMSQNGNAITLSNQLIEEVKKANNLKDLVFPMSSELLVPLIQKRKSQGSAKLQFAHVFPYSCHYYQLLDWLRQGGIALDEVEVHVITPADIVDAMLNNDIDGFCVGSPWNAKAVRAGVGVTVTTSFDIWGNAPEKVLGILKTRYEEEPALFKRLIDAITASCEWLSILPNRFEAALILSKTKYLDTPLEVVAPSLIGSCLTKTNTTPRELPLYNVFGSSENDNVIDTNIEDFEALQKHMLFAKQIHNEVPQSHLFEIFKPSMKG